MGRPVDQAIADGLLTGLAAGARGVVAVAPTQDATLAALDTDGVTRPGHDRRRVGDQRRPGGRRARL